MAAVGRSRLGLYRTKFCSRLCIRQVCKDERHFTNKVHSRKLQSLPKLVDQSSSFCNRPVENRLQKLCSRFYTSNGNGKNQSPENTETSASAYQGNEKDLKDDLEAPVENVTEAKGLEPTELNAGELEQHPDSVKTSSEGDLPAASFENITQTTDNKPIEFSTGVLEQQSEYVETSNVREDLKENESIELNTEGLKGESDIMKTSTGGENLISREQQNLSVSNESVTGTERSQELKPSHEIEPRYKIEPSQKIEPIYQKLENQVDVSSETVKTVEPNTETELRNEELNERETELRDKVLNEGLNATDNTVETLDDSKEKELSDLYSKEKNVLADTVLKPETSEEIRHSNVQSQEILDESKEIGEAVDESKKTEISSKHVLADILVTALEDKKEMELKEKGHTINIIDDNSKDMVSKIKESKPLVRLEEYIENEVKVEFEDEPDILYKKIDLLIKSIDKEVLNSYLMFLQMAALGLEINFQTKPRPKVWIQRYSVRKSIHIYKKHYRQYERRTYIQPCTIHKVTGSTASVFLEYIQRNLPEGVAMEVKKHQIDVFPDHLKPIIREAESSEA